MIAKVLKTAAALKAHPLAWVLMTSGLAIPAMAVDFPLRYGVARKGSAVDTVKAKQKWQNYLSSKYGRSFSLPQYSAKNSSSSANAGKGKAKRPAIVKVKPGTNWQWQLSGVIDTKVAADVYNIDLFDAPRATIAKLKAKGKKVICYFSAGSFEAWRPDALFFPKAVLGKKMVGWDEKWLDIRAVAALRPIMARRLDLAAFKGCDAVEPDNVDGYTNATGFKLSGADQLRYNKMIAIEARRRGLAVGLKNDGQQAEVLEPWFDFAVVEQCFEYKFCYAYQPFIKAGKAVLGAEYNIEPAKFCKEAIALGMDFIYKKLDLGVFRISCRDYLRHQRGQQIRAKKRSKYKN